MRRLAVTAVAGAVLLLGCSGEAPEAAQADPPPGIVIQAFGDRYEFSDGVSVTVAPPIRGVSRPDLVTIAYTVTNGTTTPLTKAEDLAFGFHAYADVNGASATMIFVPGMESPGFPTIIPPGESGTQEITYEAPPGADVRAGWKRNGATAVFAGVAD